MLLFVTLYMVAGQDVTVTSGKILIKTGNICNITMYNTTLYNVQNELPGLYYGLITYRCENASAGHIISVPKCFNCGVYCPQNDLLLTCNQFWFPFIMGSKIGIAIALVVFYTLRYIKNKYYDIGLNYIKNRKQNRREKKLILIRKYLETEKSLPSAPEEEQNLPPTIEKSEQAPSASRRNSITAVLLSSLLASNHLSRVESCDRSLYITSANVICEDSTCVETNTFLLTMENNMKVCFNGDIPNSFALRMTDHRAVATYNYIYQTSSYKIDTETYSLCKGPFGECWRGGCKKFEKHPRFEEKNNNTVYGYGCDTSSKFYGVCWVYSDLCTWYQWYITVQGPLYKVYKLNHKGFEIDFEISFKNMTWKEMITDRNLNMNLDQIGTTDKLSFPLSVISTLGPEQFFAVNSIEIDGEFYDTDACELNLPMRNRIGDVQIDKNNKIAFDRLSIDCSADNNAVDCVKNTPAVEVFKKNKKHRNFKRNEKITDYIVRQKISSHKSVSLMFSNKNLKSLEIMRPRCNMSIAYSYGCRECNQNPRVIVSSNSIKQEGMMYFKSNCTFNKQYLSCSYTPQTLELLKDEEYCYIYLNTINATLYINIKYEFIGEVMFNPLVHSDNSDLTSLMNGVISNPNFLDGIVKSFMLSSSLILIVSMVIRIIEKMALMKVAANATKEQNR